jgi:hypothetical protein
MLQTPNRQLEGHSPYSEDFSRATNSLVHLRTQPPTKILTTTDINIQVTLQFVTLQSQDLKYACIIYLHKELANFPSHP